MKNLITYSAPAKVILSGEHAVVYGKPALVSSIDLRLKFSLWESEKVKENEIISLIAKNAKRFLEKQNIKLSDGSFDYRIESKIPIRRGLGSSAAFSVAASAALMTFYSGREFSREDINQVAYQGEKYFHKNASGVDSSTSCFGGLIYYRKEFEFLKNISALNFKIPQSFEENLFLIDSGKSTETTGYLIQNVVGELYNKKPQFVEEIFNDIEKVTKRIVVSLIKEDKFFFMRSIIDNQVLLEMLGIVSSKVKKMLRDLEPYGIGKVTGAGGKSEGSGYLLFFAKKPKELEEHCKKKNIHYIKFKQSKDGVKREL